MLLKQTLEGTPSAQDVAEIPEVLYVYVEGLRKKKGQQVGCSVLTCF